MPLCSGRSLASYGLVLTVSDKLRITLPLPPKVCDQEPCTTTGAIAAYAIVAMSSAQAAEPSERWELFNGNVKLLKTTELVLDTKERVKLQNPSLIGSGGGGAVFSFDDSSTLLKVSWSDSAKSVERECRVLKSLEVAGVESAERCRGMYPYSAVSPNQDDGNAIIPDDSNERVVIAVEPYVRDAVATVTELPSKSVQSTAVKQIARTLVQMLASNTVTIDVQPLISKLTGDVIFIDMTEAQVLRPPFSFLDKTLFNAFVTEMWTLIPEKLLPVATDTVLQELGRQKTNGVLLSAEAMEVLESQTGISINE